MEVMIPITLDVTRKPPVRQYITAKQSDNGMRVLRVKLVNEGAPLIVPDGVTAVMNCEKPDQTHTETVGSIQEGELLFELSGQTLAVPGGIIGDVQLIEGMNVLTSVPFEIRVTPPVIPNSELVSSDEYNALALVMSQAREALDQAEDALGQITASDYDGRIREESRIRAEEDENLLKKIADEKLQRTEDLQAEKEARQQGDDALQEALEKSDAALSEMVGNPADLETEAKKVIDAVNEVNQLSGDIVKYVEEHEEKAATNSSYGHVKVGGNFGSSTLNKLSPVYTTKSVINLNDSALLYMGEYRITFAGDAKGAPEGLEAGASYSGIMLVYNWVTGTIPTSTSVGCKRILILPLISKTYEQYCYNSAAVYGEWIEVDYTKIGNTDDLKTYSKDSLVSAINEVFRNDDDTYNNFTEHKNQGGSSITRGHVMLSGRGGNNQRDRACTSYSNKTVTNFNDTELSYDGVHRITFISPISGEPQGLTAGKTYKAMVWTDTFAHNSIPDQSAGSKQTLLLLDDRKTYERYYNIDDEDYGEWTDPYEDLVKYVDQVVGNIGIILDNINGEVVA